MKYLLAFMWVGLCGLAMPGLSQAVPMQYRFEGTIGSTLAPVGWNGPGSLPSDYNDLMSGQPMSLTVLLDLDVWADNSLNQATLLDYSDNLVINQTPGPGLDFVSYIDPSGPNQTGSFHSDSVNNKIKFGWTSGVGLGEYTDFNWSLGTRLTGFSYQNWLTYPDAGLFGFEYEMYLTDISEYRSTVTEPASLALMSIGLLGLGFARRRRAG